MLDEHLKYPNALPKGYTLEHYRIIKTLAEDHVSLSYLASTPQQEMVVIVEYLPKHLALRNKTNQHVQLKGPNCKYDYEWGLAQYQQEVSALMRVKHPHINAIQDSLQTNKTLYTISKYIHGVSLQSYVNTNNADHNQQRPSEDEIKTLLTPLLSALNMLHQAGYLHGDLNPHTIMIDNETHKPIITQLGTIKYLFLAHTNLQPPSIHYAAYEQYYHVEQQGVWTDIYAMGAILYELTTGILPTASTIRFNTTFKQAVELAQVVAKEHYSKHFLAAIDHAMQLAVTERPHTIEIWAKELGVMYTDGKEHIDDNITTIENTKKQGMEKTPAPEKELSIIGLTNTDQQSESNNAIHIDFDTLSQPLSMSQKTISSTTNHSKRYITILLLISLIVILIGGAFYYLQWEKESNETDRYKQLTTSPNQPEVRKI